MYEIVYTNRALKHLERLKQSRLNTKVKTLVEIIINNPFQNPPPYEKLQGNLFGAYSRRINKKHRLVYQVYEEFKIIKILSFWSHYENV